MASSIEPVISTLNDLIATCKDGEAGFRTASESVEDTLLRHLFNDLSQQRRQLANELQTEVAKLGGSPQHDGNVSAALHRGWINIKSLVACHDDTAILAECERGEDTAIEAYSEAMKTKLPPQIRQIVSRQCAVVQAAHDRVRELATKSPAHDVKRYVQNARKFQIRWKVL